MKLTKVSGIYHSKEIDPKIGCLNFGVKIQEKENDIKINEENKMLRTKKIVEERFKKQIESRISKEFFRILEGKNYKQIEKAGDKLEPFYSFYLFIKELYLKEISKESNNWNLDELLKIDLDQINMKEGNYSLKKEYKLQDNQYLLKTPDEKYKFKKLFKEFQKEASEIKGKSKKEIKELGTYKLLGEVFKKYLERKIELIIKSLENNRISIEIQSKEESGKKINIIENVISSKEDFYIKLLEKCKDKLDEDILNNEIDILFKKSNIEPILDIVVDIINNDNIKNKAIKVLNEVRKAIKEQETNKLGKEEDIIGISLIFLELKIHIEKITNISKKMGKKNEGKNNYKDSDNLYNKFLKKELGSKLKIEKRLKENFKNRYIMHVLDYGKYMHYKPENVKVKGYSSKELEYIKAEESLVRKIATILGIACHSYNKLNKDNTEEKIGEMFCIFDVKNIDFKKLRYYFPDIEGDEEYKNYCISIIHSSLNRFRNSLAHFGIKKLEMKNGVYDKDSGPKYSEKCKENLIKNLQNIKNTIESKVKEKFHSNNVNYYYETNNLKHYFDIYKFFLLKKKVSYAPSFKRVLNKGENLYEKYINEYSYFFFDKYKEENFEEKKAYINTKNYLLKELYYNNFFNEFLEDKTQFKKAIKKAKARKEKSNRINPKAGVAYNQFLEYDEKYTIQEYISTLHSLETEKLKEEKYIEDKNKKKSAYINEYLEDIFLEGFIEWLNKNKFLYLGIDNFLNVDYEREEFLEKNEIKVDEVNVNFEEEKAIMAYFFLSFVDNTRLSQFANELVKYKQYLNKRGSIGSEEKIFEIDIDIWRKICELILLTREELSTKKCENIRNIGEHNNHLFKRYYSSIEEYNQILKNFVTEDIYNQSPKEKEQLLYHNTDGETPLLYGNLEKTRKFGINDILQEMGYAKYSEKERKEYLKLLEEIGKNQKEKSKIHREWERCKSKNDKELIYRKNLKNYTEICEKIRKYDFLKKKETLYIPFQLHEIASDIQSRFLAFINKRDRDYQFFQLAYGAKNGNYNQKYAKEFFGRESYIIRNYITHFHHYIDNKISDKSFIDQMNYLIDLFSYDKKTKNQINKSVKTILEKYNIEIKFELENEKLSLDKYKIKSISSKKGKLLGKIDKFDILEEDFITEVKKLLEYKQMK
ncbi:type VI-A CRISPR-associated RNA-guided ribonuclease Cas13a [Cetobacterium somerae]